MYLSSEKQKNEHVNGKFLRALPKFNETVPSFDQK